MPIPPKPFPLTPADVARHLEVSVATVRRWLAEGRLEGRRVGGRLRVEQEDVERLVTPARKQGGDAASAAGARENESQEP
jgi:excisionase family DNA binding protein